MKLFFLLLISTVILSAELDIPGWEKTISNDVEDQKVIVFNKVVQVGELEYRLNIMQVRNGNDWHRTQSWSIKNDNRWTRCVWNLITDDGTTINRWNYQKAPKDAIIVVGTAEKGVPRCSEWVDTTGLVHRVDAPGGRHRFGPSRGPSLPVDEGSTGCRLASVIVRSRPFPHCNSLILAHKNACAIRTSLSELWLSQCPGK
jgi:hypothetical protein